MTVWLRSIYVSWNSIYCTCCPGPSVDSVARIFQSAGVPDIRYYHYWDNKRCCICLENLLADLEKAPENSVVVLSASAHYPTGADLSQDHWYLIANLIMVTIYCFSTLRQNVFFSLVLLLRSSSVVLSLFPTEAQTIFFFFAAFPWPVLWRFTEGCLACAAFWIKRNGVFLCSVTLTQLWPQWWE